MFSYTSEMIKWLIRCHLPIATIGLTFQCLQHGLHGETNSQVARAATLFNFPVTSEKCGSRLDTSRQTPPVMVSLDC